MSAISSCKDIENKYDVCRGKYCMKIFCEPLREKFVKELAEEFKGQFTCLGEYNGKYITFSVLIENEVTRIDKNGEEITKTISCRLKSIDRFMASLLSNLDNIAEGTHKIKHTNCYTCCIEFKNAKDDLIK